MTCMSAVRRTLIKLGIYPSPEEVEFKEAETDNLVVDRDRVMATLGQQNENFKAKSELLAANADQRKGDLDELLDHINRITHSTTTARTLIERLIRHH